MKKHQTSKDNFKEIFLRFYVCVFGFLFLVFSFLWWTVPDSNWLPPRCKRGALPTELTARNLGLGQLTE